ncbi:MAG: hypothetical protein KKD44_28080 [Proteobacteria bacterium]|nr:hypothetical protein [Pseudomonadota bacterium]
MPATYNGHPETLVGLVHADSPNWIEVIAAFTGAPAAVWATVASHEVFTVTGVCRVRMGVGVEDDVDSAAHGATVSFGYAGSTAAYIAATDEEAMDAGEFWYDVTPTTLEDPYTTVVFDRVINGLDIGYEIFGEALTTGSLRFYCVWEPLTAGASVVAGPGTGL